MKYNQVMLGNNIRILRIRRQLNLNELADSTGVNPPHLGLIERGQRRIRIETLCNMSTYFNISLDTLVYKDLSSREELVAREDTGDLHEQIQEMLRGATREELQLVLNVLKNMKTLAREHGTDLDRESKPDEELKY